MIEEMERDWVDRKDDDKKVYEKIWIVPPDGEIPSSQGRLNLLTRLLNLGYDLVLVDLPRHIEFKLEDTAQALAMVMQEVWDESLKINPIKALDVSMGGLLSVMATNWGARGEYGYSFRTNLVITSDTPHRGAFMPMSIQNFVYNVKRIRNNQEYRWCG